MEQDLGLETSTALLAKGFRKRTIYIYIYIYNHSTLDIINTEIKSNL